VEGGESGSGGEGPHQPRLQCAAAEAESDHRSSERGSAPRDQVGDHQSRRLVPAAPKKRRSHPAPHRGPGGGEVLTEEEEVGGMSGFRIEGARGFSGSHVVGEVVLCSI
jgi:hypothetical protein